MSDNQTPPLDETDDVEGHGLAQSGRTFPKVNHTDTATDTDDDDVEGHGQKIIAAEPGLVSGAISPDDSLPSFRG